MTTFDEHRALACKSTESWKIAVAIIEAGTTDATDWPGWGSKGRNAVRHAIRRGALTRYGRTLKVVKP